MSQYNYILWEKILAVAFCRNHQQKNVNDTVGTAVSLLHRAQRAERRDFRSETKRGRSGRWRAGAARVPNPSLVSSRVPTSEQVDLPRAGVVRCARGLLGTDPPQSVVVSCPHNRTAALFKGDQPSRGRQQLCRQPVSGNPPLVTLLSVHVQEPVLVPPSSARIREPLQVSLLSCREASHGPQRAGAGGTWHGQLR